MSEQRSATRYGLQLEVELTTTKGRKLRAQSENLSAGGAMLTLHSRYEFEIGETFVIAFSLSSAEGEPISVLRGATVRWVSDLLPDMLGVAFDQALDAAAAQRLGELGV